jgi:hypothetical protein
MSYASFILFGVAVGQPSHVQPQFRHQQRRVAHIGAFGAREFADSIYGIMVVKREQQAAAGIKGKGFAYEFECGRSILREDKNVIFGAGVEVT